MNDSRGDAGCRITDTFPAFVRFWERVKTQPLDVQIERWADEYMAQWPDLLAMQQQDYEAQGIGWRDVAREHVFPFLPERRPAMIEARQNLLVNLEPVYRKARAVLGLDFDVHFVIYVGIGLGAGWATRFRDMWACLFGLENIAECQWSGTDRLVPLAAHEISHLLHFEWRARAGLPPDDDRGAFWQLYEEGFAQYCEHRVAGAALWREQAYHEGAWLAWCRANQARLATHFLRAVERDEPVNRFFGSWRQVDGHSQTGYFLGYEMMRRWQETRSLKEIALLPPGAIDERVQRALEAMAAGA
ncbi:MAG: hypothetical protein JXB47_08660 [Anaerolineae bacterium]|nr:hypothetical protein [Anaerolineae bacterium]